MNKPIHTDRARSARRVPPRGFVLDAVFAGVARLPRLSPGLLHTLGRLDSSLPDKGPLPCARGHAPLDTQLALEQCGVRDAEPDVGSPRLNDEWPAAAWESPR